MEKSACFAALNVRRYSMMKKWMSQLGITDVQETLIDSMSQAVFGLVS